MSDDEVVLNFHNTISEPTTTLNFGTMSVNGGNVPLADLSGRVITLAQSGNAVCKAGILKITMDRFNSGLLDALFDTAATVE